MDWTTGPLDLWTILDYFFDYFLEQFWPLFGAVFGPIFSTGASRLKMLTHKSTVEDRKRELVMFCVSSLTRRIATWTRAFNIAHLELSLGDYHIAIVTVVTQFRHCRSWISLLVFIFVCWSVMNVNYGTRQQSK